jgi:pyridoxamine 5'-phosphate oxidase
MSEHWDLLVDWLPANDDPDRPRITISTATPDARTLLLSEFDEEGFYFHTDSRSRKVAQLAEDPRVALTFLWPDFTRQLVVIGTAEVAPVTEQQRAYRARSPYLKQLAWQNSLEFAQLPVEERRRQWAEFTDDPAGLQPPETWIGFLVRPQRLTFWQGDPLAASLRTEFTLVDGDWEKRYLAG